MTLTTRVACIIPAYQARERVGEVIAGLRRELPAALIIGVDDGSTDGTSAILRELCDVTDNFTVNRGKGAALRAGFAAALGRDCTAVITVDADGQHDPAMAPRLLEALAGADLVVGARTRAGSAMPVRRRATNAMSAAAFRMLTRVRLDDIQSGYRGIRASVIHAVHGVGDRYEYETDFLIRAARAGFRITSVPVPTIYGPPSNFRQLSDGIRVVGTVWRHAMRTSG